MENEIKEMLLNQLVMFKKLCELEDKVIKNVSGSSSYKNYADELKRERESVLKSIGESGTGKYSFM